MKAGDNTGGMTVKPEWCTVGERREQTVCERQGKRARECINPQMETLVTTALGWGR